MIILSISISNAQNENTDNIIFKDKKGNQISLDDLKGSTGTYNWQIMEDKNISNEAQQLHQEARQHGGNGEYDLSIKKLKKANKLAPDWAYPIYDLAFTYLLQQDFSNALKYYQMTDEMEPRGFFTAKTAHWSLKKEKEGKFNEGLYLAFMQIEWMNSEEEKLEFAKTIVDKFPEYAPAWKVIASKSSNNEERLVAAEKGLNADPDEETKGMPLINKALVKDVQEKTEEAKKILGELIVNEETTLANIEMAKLVLLSIVERN